ncbi:Pvc16 family protein [Streptomyces sp. NPDC046862]|uniref:Pvc16 family protein n=1 Tax=Streptomyces sp. NPDC046862 TaxID=3154603 RepID=UPI0034561126
MSNALAIAHVTQALAVLIESNLAGPELDLAVKMELGKPPAEPPSEPTISVFCYQVTPNVSQRGNDLPTRAADGTLRKRPAAALDLHYLISAYGEESELVGERLIGSVVRTLHEIPILPKDVIERAGEKPYLAGSDLVEAAQRVRFTPTVMDIDETSKLWGMLYQTPYALSVVYQAALVFIEGRETPVAARPVERTGVTVLPFGAPGAPVPPGSAGAGAAGAGAAADEASGSADPAEAVTTVEAAKTPSKAVAKPAVRTPAKSAARTATKPPAATRKAAQPTRSAKTAKSAKKTVKPAEPTAEPMAEPMADGKSDNAGGGAEN